jgi:hypothetical protein
MCFSVLLLDKLVLVYSKSFVDFKRIYALSLRRYYFLVPHFQCFWCITFSCGFSTARPVFLFGCVVAVADVVWGIHSVSIFWSLLWFQGPSNAFTDHDKSHCSCHSHIANPITANCWRMRRWYHPFCCGIC